MFRAAMLSKDEDEGFSARISECDDQTLIRNTRDCDVVLRMLYSTLNYKDALALTNRAPVVRRWPMVAGIDGIGRVETSEHGDFKPGDLAMITGWGVGERYWGCLAERARFKAEWLIAPPRNLSARQTMALGTAGLTAMLCARALREQGVSPADGEILVTGASGGVGRLAVNILSRWGYKVVASSGKIHAHDTLTAWGATQVIDRKALSTPGKPLQKEYWAGVIDTVGSHTLANACAQTRPGGVVAACGMAQGMDLPTTVAPFILRGIKLIGIHSVMLSKAERIDVWKALAQTVDFSLLESTIQTIGLDEVFTYAQALLAEKLNGRVVVKLED